MTILIFIMVIAFAVYFITIMLVDFITSVIWEIGKVVLWKILRLE